MSTATRLPTAVLLLASLAIAGCGGSDRGKAAALNPPPAAPAPSDELATAQDLGPRLAEFAREWKVPGIAAALVSRGRIVAIGAAGTRRLGWDAPVGIQDRFHIGSSTKALTATVAAALVDRGLIRFDTTLAEAFPGVQFGDRRAAAVTLAQLLCMAGGFAAEQGKEQHEVFALLFQVQNLNDIDEMAAKDLPTMRRQVAERWLNRPLAHQPGATMAYANIGFLIAGSMCERAAGRSWEELVRELVYQPLGMTSGGFGPAASMGAVDAAWGHLAGDDGKLVAVPPGPSGDLPAVLGPAGLVHCSVVDFARWAAWNAGDGRRPPLLVRADTLKRMRDGRFPGVGFDDYAFGWGRTTFAFAPRPLLFHYGSNGLNQSAIWIDREQDRALVVLCNATTSALHQQGLPRLAGELWELR
ncbi:MAG: beta-lactamase family protein [Planctomycetes bacterium]|nr:beta-lactamase family protein [Planctomycetota bacterium]